MKKKYSVSQKDFIRNNYIVCPHCAYSNEKQRFRKYGTCLRCGNVLDEKVYFMIKMQRLLKENYRKSR